MRLFLKRPCIAGGCSWTKMIVYVQISWRELIFVIYLAYLEANLNDSFFGDLGIDFVNPSVNTVLVRFRYSEKFCSLACLDLKLV